MSPRRKKHRTCDCNVTGSVFKPRSIPMGELESVELLIDELEALRLCDAGGMTQEEAGTKMGVSRGTVQRIITSARKKTAEALSGCKAIVIEATLCDTNKDKQ